MKVSCVVGARTAGLELAVFAFEYEPVRARMAHTADPLDECALGLDEFERVGAVGWYGHDD